MLNAKDALLAVSGLLGGGSGGGGGETVYTSSTGMLYTPKMTIVVGGDLANGRMIFDTLLRYGNMPYLEELTLTGTMKHVSARTLNGNAEDLFSAAKFPALRKLRIAPDEIRTDSGAVIDPSDSVYNAILWNHYAFTGTNLAELEIGKVGGPYMYYGGYFRKDLPVPPGPSKTDIGSEIGMTLIVYVSEYSATGKFANGVLAPNTTVICKDYRTGEVLTA